MFEQVSVKQAGYGSGENRLVCGNVMSPPAEIMDLAGKVQCVYLDPPFMTGGVFDRTRPYGEKGWKKGTPVARFKVIEGRGEASAAVLLEGSPRDVAVGSIVMPDE